LGGKSAGKLKKNFKVLGVFWHGFPTRYEAMYANTFHLLKYLPLNNNDLTILCNKRNSDELDEEIIDDVRVKKIDYLAKKNVEGFGKKNISIY
jgi:hypothetical protein